jgi:hypothetical protein
MEVDGVGCVCMDLDRDVWWAVVDTVMSLRFAWNVGDVSTVWAAVAYSRKAPVSGINCSLWTIPNVLSVWLLFFLNVSCPVTHWLLIECQDVPHTIAFFYARSQNCETVLSALSCLPVCSHGTTPVPLDKFSSNLIFEYFLKISGENSSFFTVGQE